MRVISSSQTDPSSYRSRGLHSDIMSSERPCKANCPPTLRCGLCNVSTHCDLKADTAGDFALDFT